jgi:flagellar motor switch protein FliN/FliY
MGTLEDVSVDLSIVLGSATLPIRQILKMSRGAMIPLDHGEDDPTLVYANEVLVARGQVRVEEDQIFLEISEVVKRGAS